MLMGTDGWQLVGDLRCSWQVGGEGEIWEMGGNFGVNPISCSSTHPCFLVFYSENYAIYIDPILFWSSDPV